nr:hypothetical protein B0A51_05621 [Rachicladosporium sp. CCFEE 5018]
MPKRVRSEAWQEQRRAKNKKRGDRHFDRLRTEVEESAEAERVRSTEPLRRETMRVGFLLNEEEEEVTISQESPIVLEEPDVPVSNATVKETSSGNVQDAPVVELESFGQPSEAETEEEEARRVQAELRLKVSLVRNEPINGAGQRFGVGWDFAKRRIMERSMVDRAMEGGAWPSDALEAELTEAHEYIAKQDEYIATQDVEIMQLREQLTLV